MNSRVAVTILIIVLATAAVAALLVNIFERKQEAKSTFFSVVELNENIDDPAVWAKNFPLQYDDYLKTVDQTRSRYGGSEHCPILRRTDLALSWRVKTGGRSAAENDVGGYAFSTDHRTPRSLHADRPASTERVLNFKQPAPVSIATSMVKA
jgi:nitrite reductase (cytochrome c-552)